MSDKTLNRDTCLAPPARTGVALFVARLAINLDQLLDFEKALRVGYKAIDL